MLLLLRLLVQTFAVAVILYLAHFRYNINAQRDKSGLRMQLQIYNKFQMLELTILKSTEIWPHFRVLR